MKYTMKERLNPIKRCLYEYSSQTEGALVPRPGPSRRPPPAPRPRARPGTPLSVRFRLPNKYCTSAVRSAFPKIPERFTLLYGTLDSVAPLFASCMPPPPRQIDTHACKLETRARGQAKFVRREPSVLCGYRLSIDDMRGAQGSAGSSHEQRTLPVDGMSMAPFALLLLASSRAVCFCKRQQ